MPDQYYFVSPENTRIGPIPWTVLEQLHLAGTIDDETLTAPESAPEWIRFHDLKSQREARNASQVPRSRPQGSGSSLSGILEEKAEWLKSLIPDKILTKAREENSVVAIVLATTCLVTLGGYAAFSILSADGSSSSRDETTARHGEPIDRNPVPSGLPKFNPNMSAQEMNERYARPGSSVQGNSLNGGRGITQESMDRAMQDAANAFGPRGTTRQSYPPPPQNKPAALSTYGTKPQRYRNFRGEVREFIGSPPGGWTPVNN